MSNEYYIGLLYRSFSGDLSLDEQKVLDRWMAEGANAQEAAALKEAWELAEGYRVVEDLDMDREFALLQKKIQANPSKESWLSQREVLRYSIAASILIAIGAFVLLFSRQGLSEQVIVSSEPDQAISLPDGTTVWLQRGARLTLSGGFGKSQRTASLKGDAYFEVQHDPSNPFEVRTSNEIITVLGTSFHVAQSGNQRIIQLIEGQIRLNDATGQELVVLRPGERYVRDFSGVYKVEDKIDKLAFSWQSGILSFEQTPLRQVTEILSEFYQKDIRIGTEAMLSCTLTATFEGLTVDEVVETIITIFNMKAESLDGHIRLIGGICQ